MTVQTPDRKDIADVLDKAAQIIDTQGWHKDYLYDEAQADAGVPLNECRVCTLGAINQAVTGEPRYTPGYTNGDEPMPWMVHFAEDAMRRHLGDPSFDVAWWNDQKERTAEDVTTALRDAARNLREAS